MVDNPLPTLYRESTAQGREFLMDIMRHQDGTWEARKGIAAGDLSKLDAVHDFCLGAATILRKGSPRHPILRVRVENTTGKLRKDGADE